LIQNRERTVKPKVVQLVLNLVQFFKTKPGHTARRQGDTERYPSQKAWQAPDPLYPKAGKEISGVVGLFHRQNTLYLILPKI
jgi:hypothetical protein